MLLCVSLWNIELAGLKGAYNANFAHLWGDIFRIGLIFIPPTFLHFAFLFTNPHDFSQRSRKTILIFYVVSCFLAAISWTQYFHGEVIAYPWGYSFKSGPLYFLFILEFAIAGLLSSFYLVKGYKVAGNYQKQRLKFFFLAIIISFALGSLGFLPKFGLQIYSTESIAITVGLLIAAYSVVQHRLMDVSVFLSKGLGYILSISTFAIPVLIIIFLAEEYFFEDLNVSFSLIMLATGTVVALLFHRVKEHIEKTMRQIIVRDKYSYLKVLDEFTRRLVTIVDLSRLLNMMADTIQKSMGVKHISVFLHEAEKEGFRVALLWGSPDNAIIKISEPCIKYLEEKREAILRTEVEYAPKNSSGVELLGVMTRFEAEIFLPLVYVNRLIGFINLGPKSAKEIYYQEDLDLLNFMAYQAAIAIENANLYENLKRSQGIMRRADRLASLGTLIASLAHEIRNPLVSIKTFTQLLPERIDDEEFRSYFLKVASGEIDRLTGLINELLGFARPSEPRPQGEDINAIIEKMEVLISTEARKKNITLSKKYAPELPQIKVDAEQIKQVLLNILLNAIQAIKGEGQVSIETRLVQVPGEERIDPYIQVEIQDTGMGIPRENLERIFDPFFSTRPDGSGLGLAISHQIVHEHGGFISVESEVGKGTSFKVHLPLKPGVKGELQD